MLRVLALATALCALCASTASAAPPPIRHVFVIVLENENADTTFGAKSPAPYLAQTLPSQGALLSNYYGIGHESLDNYIAMLSGQAPNVQTQADCQIYSDFAPGTPAADGQVTGQGCVYPAAVKTVADQLDAKALSWKGYMEDMGADPAREPATCGHPALNSRDGTQSASAADQYAARHNPFLYFHSIIDDQARCDARDVPLSRLPADLGSVATTPSFSFITPDLCHDGHDATCADGGPGGLPAANTFLQDWVPRIVGSPAFKDGLLIVTFDEAETEDDSTACCNEQTGPNTPNPGGPSAGPGGGRIGAVALSPYIKAGTRSSVPYNHYSLLRSVEDIYGLDHLGYAAQAGLAPFGDDVYSNPAGTTMPNVTPTSGTTGTCQTTTVSGNARRVPAHKLLSSVRLRRKSGRRVVTVRAAHYVRVTVRSSGAKTRALHLGACRTVSFTLGKGSHGAVRVTGSTARHYERRTL